MPTSYYKKKPNWLRTIVVVIIAGILWRVFLFAGLGQVESIIIATIFFLLHHQPLPGLIQRIDDYRINEILSKPTSSDKQGRRKIF